MCFLVGTYEKSLDTGKTKKWEMRLFDFVSHVLKLLFQQLWSTFLNGIF